MPFELECPACHRKLRAPDSAAGKRVKCPGCQQPVQAPAASNGAPSISSSQVLPPHLASASGGRPAPGSRFASPAAKSKPAIRTATATPAPLQRAPVERWYLLTEDGQQYGPIGREELDAWQAEGRVTAQSQVLLEGASAWQWAPEIYPHLAAPSAPMPFPMVQEPATTGGFPRIDAGNPYAPSKSSGRDLSRFKKSEWVTYAAYASFFVSGLVIIRCLLALFLTGVVVSVATSRNMGGAAAIGGAVAIVVVVISLIVAVPYFMAGLGTNNRRQWGRILSIICAAFSALFGLLTLLVLIKNGIDFGRIQTVPPIWRTAIQTELVKQIIINGLYLMMWFGHAGLNFFVLLNSKYAREFR